MTRPLTSAIINERLKESGRDISLIGEYKNNRTKALFECARGHRWESIVLGVLTRNGCPHCSGKFPITQEEVNNRIKNREITLIQNFKNIKTKALFECKNGHRWSTNVHHVLSGRGCPSCVDNGFKPHDPAYAYILNYGDFLKYGITNSLTRRLKEHKQNGHYVIVDVKSYNVGHDALLWENSIKSRFGGRFASREQCPDGYTETLSLSLLEQLQQTFKNKYNEA